MRGKSPLSAGTLHNAPQKNWQIIANVFYFYQFLKMDTSQQGEY
jgi:hypothetical protein